MWPAGINGILVICGTVVPKSAPNPKVNFISGPSINLFCTWSSMPWMSAWGLYVTVVTWSYTWYDVVNLHLFETLRFMYSPIILSHTGHCSWGVVITGRCFFHTLLCIAHPQTVPYRWVMMLFVTLWILGKEIEDLVVFKNQTGRSFEDGWYKGIGCLWCQPIILKLPLVLASLGQKHLFSKLRTDHTVADFAGISELK